MTRLLVLAAVCRIASQVHNEADLHVLLDTFLKTCTALVWINALAIPFASGWNIDENNGLNRFQGLLTNRTKSAHSWQKWCKPVYCIGLSVAGRNGLWQASLLQS